METTERIEAELSDLPDQTRLQVRRAYQRPCFLIRGLFWDDDAVFPGV